MKSKLLIPMLIAALSVQAQIGYYKTFEDYTENNLTPMDAFLEIRNAGGAYNMWFMKSGKKVKILSEDIWGFKNNNELYRLANIGGQDVPVRVLYSGDGEKTLCLYVPYQSEVKNENGKPVIDWKKQVVAYGMVYYWCFLSKALHTEVVYCGIGSGGNVDDFRDNYPQYKPFFDCTGKSYRNNEKLVECYPKAFPEGQTHF